jgi:hypothetical protein
MMCGSNDLKIAGNDYLCAVVLPDIFVSPFPASVAADTTAIINTQPDDLYAEATGFVPLDLSSQGHLHKTDCGGVLFCCCATHHMALQQC